MLIKLYKVFVVGTECSRAYHLACSYVRNLEGVIPLPGLAFERIECFPASLINLFVTFFLVPIHRTTRIASLIPFQSIGQHTGVSTNTEVIGSKGTEYQATAHIETVQVTADIDRCH